MVAMLTHLANAHTARQIRLMLCIAIRITLRNGYSRLKGGEHDRPDLLWQQTERCLWLLNIAGHFV